MRLFLRRAGPGAAGFPSLRCPCGRRAHGVGTSCLGAGRKDRAASRDAAALPLGGGVSQPGGGRRVGRGFLSADAQGSGRQSVRVRECVSAARRVSPPLVPPPPPPPLLTVEVNVKQQLQPRDKHGDVSA